VWIDQKGLRDPEHFGVREGSGELVIIWSTNEDQLQRLQEAPFPEDTLIVLEDYTGTHVVS